MLCAIYNANGYIYICIFIIFLNIFVDSWKLNTNKRVLNNLHTMLNQLS